jgi:glucose/arabinose dehydrogenase
MIRVNWVKYQILGLIVMFGVMGCGQPTATSPSLGAGSTPTTAPSISDNTQDAAVPSPLPTKIPSFTEVFSTSTMGNSFPTATATIPPTATSAPTATSTATATPAPTPVATIEVAGAFVPPGFSLQKFADIVRPTGLAFDADGRLYATSQDGTIHVFTDDDGDGHADSDTLFSFGFNIPLGITVQPGTGDVYVSSNTKISILRDLNGDLAYDEAVSFVRDLPIGLHQNDNLKFGPDGWLYMGIGSTCNACEEVDSRSATIMRFDPATGEGEVIATGLRNPYDLAFHPVTGDLFATDNGRDDLGDTLPREELNHIMMGADYGWPDCWDAGLGSGCAGTETAVAFFTAHSSVNSLDFYTGDKFPTDYHNDAFVTIFGSWLVAGLPTGIMRVELEQTAAGTYQAQTEWFAQWPSGMPLGLIQGPDGALYVGDYINDVIYRISYGP